MVTIRVYDFLRQWRFALGSYGLTELPRGSYTLSSEASSPSPAPAPRAVRPWVPIGCQWNINKAYGNARYAWRRSQRTTDQFLRFTPAETLEITQSILRFINNNRVSAFLFISRGDRRIGDTRE